MEYLCNGTGNKAVSASRQSRWGSALSSGPTYTQDTVRVLLCRRRVPGQQDALVLLQLLHEGGVGLGDGAALLDVVEGLLQVPAVLLHGVGDHRGRRAAHAHLAVHQTLGAGLPVQGEGAMGTTAA